ncbi:hypothetical protein ACFSJY_11480 [Thalassotalea euphylliae]|uniref:hypothetical protein n=1 Tax=Thalassotalea euphylliae TaxID=1655234 RepID=UPI00363FEE78
MSSNEGNTKWTLYLQIATLVVLILTTIFSHFSQKSLIEHKAEIEKKEPSIFGTVVHAFLPEEYAKNKTVTLTNVLVKDGDKILGETMYLEDHLVNYPVLIAVQIQNAGNLTAKDLVIEITTPAGSLMRGNMENLQYAYADCSHNDGKDHFRLSVKCQSLNQGETKIFNLLWVPDFFSKRIDDFSLVKRFSTEVKTDDFVNVNVYSNNSPKGVILKGSIHLEMELGKTNK